MNKPKTAHCMVPTLKTVVSKNQPYQLMKTRTQEARKLPVQRPRAATKEPGNQGMCHRHPLALEPDSVCMGSLEPPRPLPRPAHAGPLRRGRWSADVDLHHKVLLSRFVNSNHTIIVGHCFHVAFIHQEILLQYEIAFHD